MHTSTCTHTEWGVVFMTGFPPLPFQKECDAANFFLTPGSTWGYFHVCWCLNGPCFFFTGLQVHLVCIYNTQCILHVLDNAVCSLLLTLVLPSSKLWVFISNLPLMSICILSVIPSPLLWTHACICLDHIQYSHFEGLTVIPVLLHWLLYVWVPNASFCVE